MLLDEILNEIGVQGECSGKVHFEVLALVGMKNDKRILTFIENEKYIDSLSKNSVVLTTPKTAPKIFTDGVCICEEPRLLYFKIHNYLSKKDGYRRKSFKTKVGDGCEISPLSYIAKCNVVIGDNVTIEEFVSIKEDTVIGDNCTIGTGSVIGGTGFEFKRLDNEIMSVAHVGGVIIGNNVEIQYQTVVDRAIYPWDNTVIDDYCKIDNLIHIAHSVKLKKRVLIAANALVAGRTCVGDDVWIGPSSTIINGIFVGDKARVNIGAVVTKNVADNESVTGNFAIEHTKFIRNLKAQSKDS